MSTARCPVSYGERAVPVIGHVLKGHGQRLTPDRLVGTWLLERDAGVSRHNRRVAEWRIRGTYLEFCNCDPGCGCNFRGLPTSPEGNCQAVISHVIEEGSRDGLDLAGAKVSWALWWPGPIHDKGGRGHAYIDAHRRAVRGAVQDLARGGGLRALRDLQLDARRDDRGRARRDRHHRRRQALTGSRSTG